MGLESILENDEIKGVKNQVHNLSNLYDGLSNVAIDLFVVNKKAIKFLKMPELFSEKEKSALFDEMLKADWYMKQFLHKSSHKNPTS